MCTPLAFLQAAGAALGVMGQRSNARDQADFLRNRQEVTRDQALANMVQQQATLNLRENQETLSASQAARDLRRQAERARGQIAATSGSVSGASLDALYRDFEFQEAIRERVIDTNLENTREQLVLQGEGLNAETNRRIFSATAPNVQTPSLFSGLLQIGTAALNGYSSSTYNSGGETFSIFSNQPVSNPFNQ